MKEYLEILKVTGLHALKGEMWVELWCNDIEFVTGFKTLYLKKDKIIPLSLEYIKEQNKKIIAKFKEINTANDAQFLKGEKIYCKRSEANLESGHYFIADLIGCTVKDFKSNIIYGKIIYIDNYGASDIMVVEGNGKQILIPFIDDIVKEINPDEGFVSIKKMKGLFDEN